ncbi:hypothetical protein LCGC14_2058170, partial [marine sediment metagenome]
MKGLKVLTNNKEFYPKLLKIAVPTIIQFLVSSLLNFLDIFMIGQLGTDEVAAVGIVSRIIFVSILLMVGIGSGAAVLTAQYWGKRDIPKVKRILGIALLLTSIVSMIFATCTLLIPRELVALFTEDVNVQDIGIGYLRLIGISQIFFGLSIAFFSVLISTENAKTTMIATIIALLFDTLISYCLIFGLFFFPKLGVIGTGIGTLCGRIIQFVIIFSASYLLKLPTAGKLREFFSFSKNLFKQYSIRSSPVIFQNFLWGLGSVMVSLVYARISTESIAAANIAASVEAICLLFLTGIGISAATMIGNRIGAGEEEKAENYAKKFLIISYIISFIIMITLLLIKDSIAASYNITSLSKSYVSNLILIMALIVWAKASNILFYTGILKGGGDTHFCMALDIGGIWLITVPIAFITAFVFHLPVYLVAAFIT